MSPEMSEKGLFQRTLLANRKYMKLVSDVMYFLGKWLVILLMLNIATLVLVQVFCRYVIEYSLFWAEDITKWSLVWAGYFGAACALRTNEHVSLSLFVDWLGDRARIWVLFAGKLLILFFLVCFVVLGVQQAISNPGFSWAVNVRVMWAMFGMPIAGAFLLSHLLYLMLEDLVSVFCEEAGSSAFHQR